MKKANNSNFRKLAAILCVACLAFVSIGCRVAHDQPETRANYWPFFNESTNTESGEYEAGAAGPIFSRRVDNEGREETTVRPFYSFTRDPIKQEEEHLALYPVGRYREAWRSYGAPDDRVRKQQLWLYPFFHYNYFSPLPNEYEYDYFAPFPIIMGGDSSKDGAHFSFLPFAGTFKGLLGQDEINYVLFPAYAEFIRGENHTWYFPYPLIRYGHGPNYSTLGVLPLFMYEEQEGKYERYFAAWPIISWGEENKDTAHPQTYWMVWPLLGRSWTNQTEMWTLLGVWPSIQSGWVEDADILSVITSFGLFPSFNYVRSETTDTTIIDAPWPIFRWAEGDRYDEFRLWPLYVQSRVDDDKQYQVLWPFFWYFDEKDENFTQQQFLAFPFFWSRFRQYNREPDGTIRDETDVNLWPVFAYGEDIENNWRFQFPNPIPFPNPLPYKGERFHQLYGEIFNLFSIEGGPDRSGFELAWGLANYHDDENETSFALHPFLQGHLKKYNSPDLPRLGAHERDVEEFDFLYGLTGYHCGPDGWYSRLLWFFEIPYE